jgi:hypothetical protein
MGGEPNDKFRNEDAGNETNISELRLSTLNLSVPTYESGSKSGVGSVSRRDLLFTDPAVKSFIAEIKQRVYDYSFAAPKEIERVG